MATAITPITRNTEMYSLIIDVATVDVATLIAELVSLPQTLIVVDNGEYQNVPEYSQVLLETSMTCEEVDAWLYTYSKSSWVGVLQR